MDKEYRAHIPGGVDRAAQNSKSSAASRVSDRITIGELARESGVTLRALRFYQSKGLLAPQRNGNARMFSREDRDRHQKSKMQLMVKPTPTSGLGAG
jgi:hypothetical protein